MVLDGLLKDDLLAVDLLGELAALDADALHQALGHELSPSMSTSWYFKEEEPALTIRIFIGRSPYLLLTPAP